MGWERSTNDRSCCNGWFWGWNSYPDIHGLQECTRDLLLDVLSDPSFSCIFSCVLPNAKKCLCPFYSLWAHFRSGNQQSQQSWLSKHASGRPNGNPFFHLYSYKFFTGGRPCGSSTRFRFFLATCAAGRPLVVHPFLTAGGPKRVARDHNGDCIFFSWRGCFFSLPGVDFCMTGFIYFFLYNGVWLPSRGETRHWYVCMKGDT